MSVPVALAMVQLLVVFVRRAGFPMDLEWCEGGVLYHSYRVLHGLPIYGTADSLFLPFPYPPMHAWTIAGLAWLVGLDYGTGRWVSILAIVAAWAVMVAAVLPARGEHATRAPHVPWLAVALLTGMFVGGYGLVDGWYDLVRVDSLMMAWVMAAAWLAFRWHRRMTLPRAAVVALCMTMAVYTKQTSAFFCAFSVAFVLFRSPRAGLLLGLVTAAFCSALLLFLLWQTDGLFYDWVGGNLQQHSIIGAKLVRGLKRFLLHFGPLWAAVPLLAAVVFTRTASLRTLYWAGLAACSVPVSLLPYAKTGGYINNFMPLAMTCMVLFASTFQDALRAASARRPRLGSALVTATCALVLWSGWSFRPDASRYVPSDADWANAEWTNATVGALEGTVLVPEHPFVAIRSGKTTTQWHHMGYADLIWAGQPESFLEDHLEQLDPDWLIVSPEYLRYPRVQSRYRVHEQIPDDRQVRMMAGVDIRLTHVLRAR